MKKKYSSGMTGAAFLLFELKQVSKLKLQGLTNDEIKRRVFDENLFQYKRVTSLKRVYPFIIRRCEALPEVLLEMLQTETLNNAKLINLLAIMEEDQLFKDFMIERVGEKYKSSDLLFGKADVNQYFSEKIEQKTNVMNFKESTLVRLRQTFLKVLVEAGILSEIKSGELLHVVMTEEIKKSFQTFGYSYFVDILEGK